MKISVIGLGYVGAVTAACLARDGHDVLGIDVDPIKLDLLARGKSPIVEDKIGEVTTEAVASGRLSVADSVDERVAQCDLIFICVGTPSTLHGSQNLSAVERVAGQLGSAIKNCDTFPVIVLRSTMYPGGTEKVFQPIIEKAAASKAGEGFGLCFQPEFLREGSSVNDFYNPPFTVVGSDDKRAISKVRELFGDFPGQFLSTSCNSAELLKMTCNAFHALKISFANEIGRLGQSLGVDARQVMQLVCEDKSLNISSAYLRPGFAYGGSCLPKDIRAMLYLARMQNIELPLLSGVAQTNQIHIDHGAELVMSSGSRKVGMVGLSFKPGTDDLRESPLVALAEKLIGKGYELRIYDPAVNVSRLMGANKRFIDQTIPHFESLLVSDLDSVFEHSEVLVVGQNHADLQAAIAANVGSLRNVIDLTGLKEEVLAGVPSRGACW